MELSDDFIDGLEMVLLEEIEHLKQAAGRGELPSPLDIAVGYMNPEYSEGILSNETHNAALACMVGLSLHWLACREERANERT